MYTYWSKEPPPSGWVSYLQCSLITNSEEEDPPQSNWYKFVEGGPLFPCSWLGNMVNRKPPRGGQFLSINIYTQSANWHSGYKAVHIYIHRVQMYIYIHMYIYVYMNMYIYIYIDTLCIYVCTTLRAPAYSCAIYSIGLFCRISSLL